MREMFRYSFTLALICTISALFLSLVNTFTKPKILAQMQSAEEESLKEVMPDAVNFVPVESDGRLVYYKAEDKDGKTLGAAFKASEKGYSSTIDTMVGMLKDGTITSIKVLSQNETPGLGSQVSEPGFTGRFKDKLDLSDIQAITGATISSRAVINSVKEKAGQIRSLIKDGK